MKRGMVLVWLKKVSFFSVNVGLSFYSVAIFIGGEIY